MSKARKRRPGQVRSFDAVLRTAGNGRGCRGKVRHAKRKQAMTARNQATAMNPDDPRPLDVYPCDECRGWHVGHGRLDDRPTVG